MSEHEAWKRGYRDAMQASIGHQGVPLHMGAAFPADWEQHNPYPDIEGLIEASSLGTPEAKAARESVPREVGTAIALAAKYLSRAEQAEQQVREIREGIAQAIEAESRKALAEGYDIVAQAYLDAANIVRALSGVSGPTEAGDD